jgi:hypothetical protein
MGISKNHVAKLPIFAARDHDPVKKGKTGLKFFSFVIENPYFCSKYKSTMKFCSKAFIIDIKRITKRNPE